MTQGRLMLPITIPLWSQSHGVIIYSDGVMKQSIPERSDVLVALYGE